MLARRIKRDVQERGRSVDGILEQYVSPSSVATRVSLESRYLRFVKPAYDNFVQPTSRYANIVRTTMQQTDY